MHATACQQPSAVAMMLPSRPRATITACATPARTSPAAKADVSVRPGSGRPASPSASASFIRRTDTPAAARTTQASGSPEVSTTRLAPRSCNWRASVTASSSGTPGGFDPDRTTIPASGTSATIMRQAAATSSSVLTE